MGFRNKLTRLSPAQLDTMVVRNLATADSGPRIVLSSGDQQSALFYSGTTGEVGPGEIDVGIISDTRGAGTSPPADVARLYLAPPAIGTGHVGDVSLELRSPTRDGATKGYAQLVGDLRALGDVLIQGSVTYAGAGWTSFAVATRR
jgi:hypothetical protein